MTGAGATPGWDSGGLLARTWRHGAGPQLAVLFLLGALITVLGRPVGGSLAARVTGDVGSLLLLGFLVWRVWRGGRIARGLLIFRFLGGYFGLVLSAARWWNLVLVAGLAAHLICLAVLVSPAVRMRVWQFHPAGGGPAPARFWPPGWVVPWGLVAGIVVTLVSLANMTWARLPGCGAAGTPVRLLPGRCFGLQEGYPLRFLVANQGVPQIMKIALIRDWGQWSLLCCSVLYLAWWLVRPSLTSATATGGGPAEPGTGRAESALADGPAAAPDMT
jgi:hypothetical protein